MIEIKATGFYVQRPHNTTVFLAGSIEMGAAEKWQDRVVAAVSSYEDLIVLNPRRDDWDFSWKQSIDNVEFLNQVSWELRGIENADIVFFYFQPGTMSPISLLELGLVAGLAREREDKPSVIVVCPPGFHRKGNVDVTCSHFDIPVVVDSLAAGIAALKLLLWAGRGSE